MSTIPFLIAKAHANHSKSPSEQQINSMVTSDKMIDVENVLQGTAYGPILNDVRPSTNLPEFEVALRKQYANLLNIYENAATGDVEKLLHAYTMTIEAENMDLILQAIMRDNVNDELEQIVIPVGKFGIRHYRRIMENSDVEVATDFIIYPELRKAAQAALKESNDPEDRVFLLSAALSHTSFQILADVAPDWVKLEVEFLNLETICRAINLGIDPKPWLIPKIGTVYRQRNELSRMSSPEDVLTYVLPNFPVSKPLQFALDDKDPVVRLENEALKYLYYRRYRNFMLYGNRKEAILDFFSIKRAEIEDVSRILLGTLKQVPANRVRQMLYPIYRRK